MDRTLTSLHLGEARFIKEFQFSKGRSFAEYQNIKNAVSLVRFYYNDRGQRARKEHYNTNDGSLIQTTHYVREASGSVMGIYVDGTLSEQPIYGNSRLGIYFRQNDASVYQLTDHLGNVRAVVGVGGITGATDYYPFGMVMPNRSLQDAEGYRYGYQGEFAETDAETGKPAFELRLYDPRINRWLTPDPKGQFDSPYLGMGNNPIIFIDPDGGWIERPDDYKGPMGDGDWYVSDRLNNTERWQSANHFNLSRGLVGAAEYTSISQRTAFYGWYQNEITSMGHETKWAGAAFVIASQMAELDTWKSKFVSDDIVSFANAGNKAIFDDVFDDLGAVYFSKTKILGAQAELWDIKTLYHEQFEVVDPIYKEQSKQTLRTLSKMAKGKGVFWFGVPSELKFEGDLNSPMDRFNHGWTKATTYYLKYHFKN